MAFETTRFGSVEIPDDAVVDFESGLIGLGGRRYAVLSRGEDARFAWLQSLEDPTLALPLADPWRFFDDYELQLTEQDVERIGVEDPSSVTVYVTVRAGGPDDGFSANLRAPILIAGRAGFQVINQAEDAAVRASLAV